MRTALQPVRASVKVTASLDAVFLMPETGQE